MEPTSLIDDAEFRLPPEFLTDEDFLVEKENKVLNGGSIDESDNCLFPYGKRHGFESFGLNLGFGSTVKIGDERNYLAGLTSQLVQPTFEDDISGGFYGNRVLPAVNDNKSLGMTRSTLCGSGIGCGCRNQRSNQSPQSRVSSQAAAWNLYCAAAEEMARMNINDESYDYNNHSGGGLLDLPRKHPLAAARRPNHGSGFYNNQSLTYQKLQAIQFQQLKQQQWMKHHRQLVQQSRVGGVNSNKNGGSVVDLSPSAWSTQLPRREGSRMRAVFLGDHTRKRESTGTGVFLPRRVNHNSAATTETFTKPTLATVLVPARVEQVLNLNLNESVVQPVLRTSVNLNDASWRQRSNNDGISSQMKMEQQVNEPRLPSDWAY